MTPFWVIILGIVQGLTEFLPISSSGHLVLFQKLIPGFSQPGVLFDVILHFGTLAAVFFYFRKKILNLSQRYIILIIVGTLPTLFLGFFFRKEFESMFSSDKFLGYEFMITGILNILIDLPVKKKVNLGVVNSFLIGIAQAISIIPGISRSGATIFTGVRLGIDRQRIAEYSFLLSVPAILGANILEIMEFGAKDSLNVNYVLGFLASFVTGIASIGIVMDTLTKKRFKILGFYAIFVGAITLLLLN